MFSGPPRYAVLPLTIPETVALDTFVVSTVMILVFGYSLQDMSMISVQFTLLLTISVQFAVLLSSVKLPNVIFPAS